MERLRQYPSLFSWEERERLRPLPSLRRVVATPLPARAVVGENCRNLRPERQAVLERREEVPQIAETAGMATKGVPDSR